MRNFVLVCLLCVLLITIVGSVRAESDFATAKRELNSVLTTGDTEKIEKAVTTLSSFNNTPAFNFLWLKARQIGESNTVAYWFLLKGITSFSDEKVLKKLTKLILLNKRNPISRDLLLLLRNNNSANVINLLEKMLAKGTEEFRAMAIEQLAGIPRKKSVEILIQALQNSGIKKAATLKEKIRLALVGLIGRDEGGTFPEKWAEWWEANKDKTDKEILKQTIDTSNTGTAVDHLGAERRMGYAKMAQLPKGQIIVVDGICGNQQCEKRRGTQDHAFDRIQDVLVKMGIPHTVVHKYEFDKESYKLVAAAATRKNPNYKAGTGQIALILNCCQWREFCINPEHKSAGKSSEPRLLVCGGEDHIRHSARFSDHTIKKIKSFVENGGYLFTEDMVLEEVLERAFPKVLKHTTYLPENTVSIFPVPGMSTHPYLKGVFEVLKEVEGNEPDFLTRVLIIKIGEGKWKIDDESPDLIVKKPDLVDVLIVSPDLPHQPDKKAKGYGTGKTGAPVAVTFAYGPGGASKTPRSSRGRGYATGGRAGGRVLHVMSHFGKQQLESDEFVLQNLILNFLLEANQRRFSK